MLTTIVKNNIISENILVKPETPYAKEHRLCFCETDPSTKNPEIIISFNPERYECLGLNLSQFNPKASDPYPITNIFDKNAERVNKLSDGFIIGKEKGSDNIFVIIIEMKSDKPDYGIVKLQLDGSQAIFEYIRKLLELQFDVTSEVTLYRFCFTSKDKIFLPSTNSNFFGSYRNERSNSYTLGKQESYKIRHLLGYKL